ncbi:hypothetical protein OH773_00970 [Buttiauxella sp. WJP83]|uniref:hypothetical protein n=1 Tax=Buttiauxella sp. WJP83 TaxID=2986951 RepID=UPI0022DE6729|nr:hypothetical protein [Buttiauxella sp. WJP83]WBM70872.1 hypothetical protein OH773_00970 [Buttiauxella sp. WJP83]
MDEEQLIKLMNENGFTKKEIGKLLLTAEKYPATLEWVLREFARHFKPFVITLFIVSALCCIPIFSSENDAAIGFILFTIYAFIIFVAYRMYSVNYMFKCHKLVKVLKRKYKEAESDE